MGKNKEADRKNSVKKAYLKALDTLEEICLDCQISFAENFSNYTRDLVESKSEIQIQKLTNEMKSAISQLMKMFYIEKWIEIAKKAYEEDELKQMVDTLSLMIELEPVYSYGHFKKLFGLMDGLNSEKEETVMSTLFQIRDKSSDLSPEEIINSYTELARTKYKDGVIMAIIEGMKKASNKKNVEYIACYFNNESLAGEKTLN